MAKNKTTETENSVTDYLAAIPNEKRRNDCYEIVEIMQKATGFEPKMWGAGIVGFGSCDYQYESGHSGDAPLAALASRSNAIALYLATDFDKKDDLLQKFGKYKSGKACIYIQKIEDIDTGVLTEMVTSSVEYLTEKYPS